jgi:maltose O-acetyltransferase
MNQQGFKGNGSNILTVIEDDVWIGMNVLITPGRYIKKGSIIAAGCVLCKNFPEYSIIGGNPSKLIKSRL